MQKIAIYAKTTEAGYDENDEEPPSEEPPSKLVYLPLPRANRSPSKTRKFKNKFFPSVSSKLWNDWHWQISKRIFRPDQLNQFLVLSEEEKLAFTHLNVKLPLGITPYYMSLIDPEDPNHALRRTVVPTAHELFTEPGESDDPLNEENNSPVPGLVHRYPDRVLLLVSDFCSTYCRYCTRSRVVGHGSLLPSTSRFEQAIDYIRKNRSVRDVLLSGGDPLTMSDNRLDWLLTRLRQIEHVEIIRIGTKVPAVLPQRITPRLTKMLRKHHPLWMSLHFTHPEECTPEAYKACEMLSNAGIPLGSQTVLLRGINDSVDTMKKLVHNLLKMRVRPYYLYQCDPISGSGHFRTPVEKGIEIIRGLRGHTSGYAVPNYVIDAPGGGGKIPLMPNYVHGMENGDLILSNYEDRLFRYPDQAADTVVSKSCSSGCLV
ncbi:MAG: KamA family radical SAM protein [Desulfobacterales bacterium]